MRSLVVPVGPSAEAIVKEGDTGSSVFLDSKIPYNITISGLFKQMTGSSTLVPNA